MATNCWKWPMLRVEKWWWLSQQCISVEQYVEKYVGRGNASQKSNRCTFVDKGDYIWLIFVCQWPTKTFSKEKANRMCCTFVQAFATFSEFLCRPLRPLWWWWRCYRSKVTRSPPTYTHTLVLFAGWWWWKLFALQSRLCVDCCTWAANFLGVMSR